MAAAAVAPPPSVPATTSTNTTMERRIQLFEDTKNMPDEKDYPPPAPPVGKRSDVFDPNKFRDIDQRAKQATVELAMSFSDLLTYLTENLTTDLQKLRSIFMWMGTRELLDAADYPLDAPFTTPYFHLKRIASTSSRYASLVTLFCLLCRLAGLPCVKVDGCNKNVVDYVPGDEIKDNFDWYAVYVDGSWRLVSPIAAFLFRSSGSSAWVMVEDSGQPVRDRLSYDQTGQHINESLFLPDPEEFIYGYCPMDLAWQLLQEPWSHEKFQRTPFFSSTYLKTTWHLADKHEAVVEAPTGKCCIYMDRVPEDKEVIGYRLYYNEQRSNRKFPNDLQLENYITLAVNLSEQSLWVRLSEPGIYKLEIYNGRKQWLCKLVIRATSKLTTPRPFPEIPETGLGFSPAAVKAGFVDPSRQDGLVVAREGERIRFRFRTTRPLDVVARLVHTSLPSQQLDSRVTQEEDLDFITLYVNVPWEAQNPEFSLQVDAKPKDSEGEVVNVLNYLLTPDRQLVHMMKGPEQQLRDELTAATADDDVQRLESAVWEFRFGHVQEEDIFIKACNRLYDLHHAAIESAKTDENKLAAALREAEASQVAYLLVKTDWMQKAKETHRLIRRLSSVKHEVKSLSGNQVSEVQTYNHPHHSVQAAVVASYILLGENIKKLKKWSYVQSLLRRHGRLSLRQQIQTLDASSVHEERIKKASDHLSTCTAEEVRSISIGAAAFYVWAKAVVDSTMEMKDQNTDTPQQQLNSEGEGMSETPEEAMTP